MKDLLQDLLGFVKARRNYVLIPIIFVLLLMGALIVFVQSSAIAPFIYTLF
jgi:hypothetical protein